MMRALIVLTDLNGEPKFTIKHTSVGVDLIVHEMNNKETRVYISDDELEVFINALGGRV
jgi:hypothetical protein